MFAPIGSHLPVLVALARKIPLRKVVEIGSGEHSTPAFLRQHLFPDLMRLDSVENNANWASKVCETVHDERWHLHTTISPVLEAMREVDLVFVDNDPYKERIAVLDLMRELGVKLVVMHDRESYYYNGACGHWPYQQSYTPVPAMPDTVVLSMNYVSPFSGGEIASALELLRGEVFP